jgi:hypothetical protein
MEFAMDQRKTAGVKGKEKEPDYKTQKIARL